MDTNTLLIIIVPVLLLGGGGWYAQISAIALAPSRMPRHRLIRQGPSLPTASSSYVGRDLARAIWKS
jgi:hypothetical protein